MATPLVGLIMGSRSDWETMRHAAETLDELAIAYERRVVSAHRTPDLFFEYASSAEERGIRVLIAGAGGAPPAGHDRREDDAARARRPRRVEGALRDGLAPLDRADARRDPVGTLAIGRAGAVNAALLAASILGTSESAIAERVRVSGRLRRRPCSTARTLLRERGLSLDEVA